MATTVNMSFDLADLPTGTCQSRVALAQEGHHGQQEHLEDQRHGQGRICQWHSEKKLSGWPTGGGPRLTATG